MKKKKITIPKYLRIFIPAVLIGIWLALGGLGGPIFGKISEVASNDQSTFLPENAESTKVNKAIKEYQDENSIPALVIFTDDNSKKLSNESIDIITKSTQEIQTLPEVVGDISPPIISDDGKAVLLVVNVASDVEYKDFVPVLRSTIEKTGIEIEFNITGPVGFLYDLSKAFAGIDGLLLGVALAVVFVILLLVYRSPMLPFLVLINSMFALCAAILVVFYAAKAGFIVLNGQVQGILFILVIGAATDYALLFVARYREELLRNKEVYRALLASWKRSIEPIVAAGGTVMMGLLCLLLSDLNSNKALGPVGAIGIAMAIMATLTFLPSLLLMWGRTLFWPRIPQFKRVNGARTSQKGAWPKFAQYVARHARPLWIGSIVLLVVMAAGVTQLRADGVAQSEFILGQSEARNGQEHLNKHFPGGSGTPAHIIISADKVEEATQSIESDRGVDSVSAVAVDSPSGTMPLGREQIKLKQEILEGVEKQLVSQKEAIRTQVESEMEGAPSVVVDEVYNQAVSNIPDAHTIAAAAYPFKDAAPKVINKKVLLEVTLRNDADSQEAQATVERLRLLVRNIDPAALVGGTSAVQLDTRISAEHDGAVVIPAVLVVITIILMVLLRSVVAALILLATTVLSFVAILGISAIAFNHVFGFPGADPSVVLYGFIFLVALGIDYNIFLMTRVREESLRVGTRKGTLIGLAATGSVITSAGIVLAATFAALVVIPILFLVQLAFLVALGVLIDTTLVRSVLVPALTYNVGKKIWWPSKKHKD